jgi:hypothetical protein
MLTIGSFAIDSYSNLMLILLGFTFAILVLFVRFKSIIVYNDRFEIISKSLLNTFIHVDSFNYSEIKSIKFSKSYTEWVRIILGLYTRPMDRTSKSDTMDIITNDNQKLEIIRIGKLDEFIDLIRIINIELTKNQNKQ